MTTQQTGNGISADELAAAQLKARELGIPRTYAPNLVPLLRNPARTIAATEETQS